MMELVHNIFRAAVEAVLPNKLVFEAIKVKKVSGHEFLEITSTKKCFKMNRNVYIVAFGKAACGMSKAAESVLSDHLVKGIASIPVGSLETLRKNKLWDMLPLDNSRIHYREGSKDNIPDLNAFETSKMVKELCIGLKDTDLLLVLVSGGGSALLPCPPQGVSLEDKTTIIKMLGSRGADINQLNTVRQQLSELKAGGLAQLAYPANVLSLIFSDIIGNDLQFVASGPTVQCKSTAQDALNVLKSFCSNNELPESVLTFLNNKTNQVEAHFEHVTNVLVADNLKALQAAKRFAESKNIATFILSNEILGDANEIGRLFARFTSNVMDTILNETDDKIDFENKFCSLFPKIGSSPEQNLHKYLIAHRQSSADICFLWGGETTVKVKGNGKGGRNQEMTLAFLNEARKLNLSKRKMLDFIFCSAGTDGQDGPTDATGAFIDQNAFTSEYNSEDELIALNNNDSYKFFEKFLGGRYHLKFGLTGTNVMDMQILYINQSNTN